MTLCTCSSSLICIYLSLFIYVSLSQLQSENEVITSHFSYMRGVTPSPSKQNDVSIQDIQQSQMQDETNQVGVDCDVTLYSSASEVGSEGLTNHSQFNPAVEYLYTAIHFRGSVNSSDDRDHWIPPIFTNAESPNLECRQQVHRPIVDPRVRNSVRFVSVVQPSDNVRWLTIGTLLYCACSLQWSEPLGQRSTQEWAKHVEFMNIGIRYDRAR